MKLFDKKSLILLISVISINLLCIISVSYAYFTAKINGNDKAQDMVVKAGTMEITYYDSNEVSINSMLPGDSVIKKFKIVNTGTLDTKYNIKLIVEENNFIDKQDLVVTLKRNDKEDNVTNIVPVKEDGYILINEPMELKGEHDYTLTLTFKKDIEDTNQNDNANKAVKFKIGVDSNADTEIYEYSYDKDNTFYSKLKEAELNNNAAYDDFGNIRYIGKDPNNYIWFNCESYENLTNENATDEKHNCEKWRIIGDFKDTLKSDGTREDLIKIIRDEPLPNYYTFDNKPNGTGTSESSNGSNNWIDSRLMMLLNEGYESNDLNASGATGSLYWDHQKGNCSGRTSIGSVLDGTTIDCDFTKKGLKDGATKNMIETVKWELGAVSQPPIIISDLYKYERGIETCKTTGNCTNDHSTEWTGKIGLMYPSDYGYATGGGNAYNRQECLAYDLYRWNDDAHKDDCAGNNWLIDSNNRQWTIAARYTNSNYVSFVFEGGNVGSSYAYIAYTVRPTLYLKSNIKIASGNGSTEPYILIQ